MFKARLSKTGLWNAVWLLAIVCFSWMQRENIINGFQNVFFLALLLPLLAFQCLSIAHLRSHSRMWFGLALFFAFASVGTLASGVLAPPLMVLLAIIQGQSRIRIAILVGVSILAFAVYHIGTPTFPLLDSSLRTKPDALAQFFLVYLGGPLRVITNDYLVAAIAGAAFVAGSVLCFWCVVTRREGHPMFLAFTAFVAYVLATALATTMGRAVLGIVGTTPGRYTTPVLIGWAVLAILLSFKYLNHYRFPGISFSGAVLLPLFLLPSQLDAIYGDFGPIKHQRFLGVLALALNVNDKQAIGSIYPNDRIYAPAQEAKRRRLSVFGLPIFKNLPHYVGHPVNTVAVKQCQGAIDNVSTVEGQTGVFRLAGWAFDLENQRIPEEVFFVNPGNDIVGAALTGRACGAGCGNLDNKSDKLAGFDGYVMGDPKDLRIFCAPHS
ncbi:MAG: hypothetical protein JOY96_12790 [Verrucomicrobia bacterium]|nr:hypothetical protein [Verrucomicrobiota bacterium]